MAGTRRRKRDVVIEITGLSRLTTSIETWERELIAEALPKLVHAPACVEPAEKLERLRDDDA